MRPKELKTKIFVDGSDTVETQTLLDSMGFLDGQTTNPSNFVKSPEMQKRIDAGEKFTTETLYEAYKEQVQKISKLIPDGSVSIEVYADANTTAEEMLEQGRDMFSWIPNAHIKLPCTTEGLKAANQAIAEGMRVNITLVFSQEQAAAVYAATKGAKRGDVFISPFIGRLVDRELEGIDLIDNILRMYKNGDGHVEVLTASIRNLEQFTHAISIGTDIITAYFSAIKEWVDKGMPLPDLKDYNHPDKEDLPYEEIDLEKDFSDYNIKHELTDKGLEKFTADWNALLK